MTELDEWTVGDTVVRHGDTYRIRSKAGVLVGAEYGGDPLGFESIEEATEALRSRQGLAADLRHFRENRQRYGWPS